MAARHCSFTALSGIKMFVDLQWVGGRWEAITFVSCLQLAFYHLIKDFRTDILDTKEAGARPGRPSLPFDTTVKPRERRVFLHSAKLFWLR